MKLWSVSLLVFLSKPVFALDPLCTNTSNLVMKRCPEYSIDWYQSYTDIIDNLDALAKTTPSSFTVRGIVESTTGGFKFPDGSIQTTSNSTGTILNSTNVFTGADTFLSSFTVRGSGRLILISTSPNTESFNIKLATGVSAGTVIFYPGLSQENSSAVAVDAQTFTNTTFGPCLTNSTVTVVFATVQSAAVITFNGSIDNNTASSATGLSVLEDGKFLVVGGTPFSNTVGMSYIQEGVTTIGPMNGGFDFHFFAPGVGSHSFCLTGRVSANTGSITSNSVPRFSVTELR